MKDIHNHLLYGIDDGSNNLELSIKLLNDLYNRGVTDIVLTPHYIIGTDYNCNNEKKKKLINELKKNSKVNLYMGNEVYIDNKIVDYIKNKEISTINGSRYLLMELPLREEMNSASDIIFNLRVIGIVPIIAHPERYHYLDIDTLEKYIDMGCLLQGNITSLLGKYGKEAKSNLELLLKKNMIHVFGTDIHKHIIDIDECYDMVKHIVNDNNIYNDIMFNNFDKIIHDEEIVAYNIKKTGSLFNRERIK